MKQTMSPALQPSNPNPLNVGCQWKLPPPSGWSPITSSSRASDYHTYLKFCYHAIDSKNRYGALRNVPDCAFVECHIGLDGQGRFLRADFSPTGDLWKVEALTLRQVDQIFQAWERKRQADLSRAKMYHRFSQSLGDRHD